MTYSFVLDHSNLLFKNLELLKLTDIHSLQLLSFVYDCVNHMTPDYFSDYFKHVSDVHSICTRQAIRDDLFLERRHTLSNMKSDLFNTLVQNYEIVSQLS